MASDCDVIKSKVSNVSFTFKALQREKLKPFYLIGSVKM